MVTILASVIGVLGTIAGVLIGIYFSRRISQETVRRQGFQKAAAEFRNSFIDELRILEDMYHSYNHEHKINTMNILQSGFVKHEKAAIIFRAYLSDNERKKFDEFD